ncbi:Abi family protein [Carnobacteriaceae bacterium zg-ZUI78]|nr:Abi family protein [Carnobacteriaceae bacterium zg-ZUI78]
MRKEKLEFKDMLTKLRDEKGIQFHLIKENEAMQILQERSYYYKLTCYRKNFEKDASGKYIDVDFAYLVDIASIDMQLRYFLLQMSLDIEHGIKTALLSHITQNKNEDGYSIIDEFKQYDPYSYEKTISSFEKNQYLSDMFSKRKQDLPIWVLVEIMDFGTLSSFVKMYYRKYTPTSLKHASHLITSAKYIRNACAHSNVLILNIYGRVNQIKSPSMSVKDLAKIYNINILELKQKKLHDLFCLFVLYKKYASRNSRSYRKNQGSLLIERCKRNKSYYQNNKKILSAFLFFKNLVDFL